LAALGILSIAAQPQTAKRNLQVLLISLEDEIPHVDTCFNVRDRLEGRLGAIRNRMDAAYLDKLDGIITADLWQRKN
jgi:hypothetical protein